MCLFQCKSQNYINENNVAKKNGPNREKKSVSPKTENFTAQNDGVPSAWIDPLQRTVWLGFSNEQCPVQLSINRVLVVTLGANCHGSTFFIITCDNKFQL